MKRFKGFFLILVIILLVGLSSNAFAGRNGGGRDDNWGRSLSRSNRARAGRDKNSGGFGGPKLGYDGKTSGFGSRVGGHLGGLAGGAIGGKFGGGFGMAGGSIAGSEIGSKAGNKLERNGNRIAHDKWNSRGRHGNTGWRCFSLDEDENY